jgi:hypothetical protein
VASNFDFYRNTYLKTRQQQFRESAEFVKTDIQLQLMLAQVYQKEIASLEDLLFKAGKDDKKKKDEGKTLSGRKSGSKSEVSEFESSYKMLELQRQANEDMLKRRSNIYSDVQREFAPSQPALPEINRQGDSFRVGLAPANMETKARLAASNIAGFTPGTPEAEATATVLFNTLRASAAANGLQAEFDARTPQIKAAIAGTPNFAIGSTSIGANLTSAREAEYLRRIDTLGLGNNALAIIPQEIGPEAGDITDTKQQGVAGKVVEQYFYEKQADNTYKLVERKKGSSFSVPGTPIQVGGTSTTTQDDLRLVDPQSVGDINKDGKTDEKDVKLFADRMLIAKETEKQRQLEYPLKQLPKSRARYDRAMARLDALTSQGIESTARARIGRETQVKDAFDLEARRQKQREAMEVISQMESFYNSLDDNQRYLFDAYRQGSRLRKPNKTSTSFKNAQSLYGAVKKDAKIDGSMVVENIKAFDKPDEVATFLGYLFAQEDTPLRYGLTEEK